MLLFFQLHFSCTPFHPINHRILDGSCETLENNVRWSTRGSWRTRHLNNVRGSRRKKHFNSGFQVSRCMESGVESAVQFACHSENVTFHY
ncbi:hypothetical protein VIGAN_07153300 [Vigna angularis var. angularis]|uniref:Uncharacterized protein n=1 Tax=Vigna angularis var. angularis TaxID=157739 RepID=A0A0S3SIP3_PHAAN|nr:hypothetical protein VIGAN_07153300 [Vigna angularis var. angularis]